MKIKRWIFLVMVLLFLQFINLSRGEWIIVGDGGQDDDAIEIHSYEDEHKS